MKLFGRPLTRYVANLGRAPQLVRDVIRAMRIFRSPMHILGCYLTRRPPAGGVVELRSGVRIHLSDDPLDIVTVYGLFVREDYGVVAPSSRVIDIGANIGVFTLYAAQCGALVVHAYEPSTESFRVLRRNIYSNGLGDRVLAFNVAIGAGPERVVRFPRRSNVLNSLPREGDAFADCDEVGLETIETVVARMGGAELMKLDCEGEEERILRSAGAGTLSTVGAVRIEYHQGRGAAIEADMAERGFTVEHHWAPDGKGGITWFVHRGSSIHGTA